MEPIRVIVVDDEPDFIEVLVKRLNKRGVSAVGCVGGHKALEYMEEHPVDVVLLDVKMPGMDGVQTLKEIKYRHPLVEVIMLSAHADMDVAISGMEMGAFDYLLKPAIIDEVLYKIQDAYKKLSLHRDTIKKEEEAFGRRH